MYSIQGLFWWSWAMRLRIMIMIYECIYVEDTCHLWTVEITRVLGLGLYIECTAPLRSAQLSWDNDHQPMLQSTASVTSRSPLLIRCPFIHPSVHQSHTVIISLPNNNARIIRETWLDYLSAIILHLLSYVLRWPIFFFLLFFPSLSPCV